MGNRKPGVTCPLRSTDGAGPPELVMPNACPTILSQGRFDDVLRQKGALSQTGDALGELIIISDIAADRGKSTHFR